MSCVGPVDCDYIQYKVSIKHYILMLCVVLVTDVVQCISSNFNVIFHTSPFYYTMCVLVCIHASVCVCVHVFSVLLIPAIVIINMSLGMV